MNKIKIVTLTAIILMIGLLVGKRFFTGSDIRQVTEWEADADTIVLEHPGTSVTLVKQGEEWFIDQTEWKASTRKANTIASKMKEMTIYDRITESGNYARYGLDEESATTIRVRGEGETLREVFIGKQSPGVNQAYVRFPEDKAVYLAGSFAPHDFTLSANELRDRNISQIPATAIDSVTINFDNTSYTLVKKAQEEGSEEEKGPIVWQLESDKGLVLDQQKLSSMIGQLNMLIARGFTTESAVDGAPVYLAIEVAAFDKTISITMYESEDDVIVKTSERPDYFTITKDSVKTLRRTVDELLPADETE